VLKRNFRQGDSKEVGEELFLGGYYRRLKDMEAGRNTG
jgi:hypothetical protein